MVIIRTSAVDVSIHAVSPALSVGAGWRSRRLSRRGTCFLGKRRIELGEEQHSERCYDRGRINIWHSLDIFFLPL